MGGLATAVTVGELGGVNGFTVPVAADLGVVEVAALLVADTPVLATVVLATRGSGCTGLGDGGAPAAIGEAGGVVGVTL